MDRFKNIWLWIGILAAVMASANIPFESLTSWGILFSSIASIFTNPFQLCLAIGAIAGVLINPNTPGLKD